MRNLPLLSLMTVATAAAFSLPVGSPVSPARGTARSRAITCGLRVKIVSVGKTKEDWLNAAINLYEARLKNVIELEFQWVKDDAALLAAVGKCQTEMIILDERGSTCTSTQFASRLYDGLDTGGSRLTFFIGGAEGLPAELKATQRQRLLSLSQLTFTHQMARLLLVEQIYRATEIRKGSGYHKD